MKINSFAFRISLFVVIIILVSLMVFYLKPVSVAFRANGISDVTQLLTSLILVSLFLERAIEVFITVWRGPDARQKESVLRSHEARRNELKKAAPETPDREALLAQTEQDLGKARQDFLDYKSGTQRIALWTGFISGLVISLIGIRTLNTLITPDSYGGLGSMQKNLFDAGDILITGGLLAGGSDGIHKILQVFLDWADTTSNRIKTPQ